MATAATQSQPEPPADLNDVYRPYDDAAFQQEVKALKAGDDDFLKELDAPLQGGPISAAELFGDDLTAKPVELRPQADDLLNLDDTPKTGAASSSAPADLLGSASSSAPAKADDLLNLDDTPKTGAASSSAPADLLGSASSSAPADLLGSASSSAPADLLGLDELAAAAPVAEIVAAPVAAPQVAASSSAAAPAAAPLDLFADPFAPSAVASAEAAAAEEEASAKAKAAEAVAKAAAESGVDDEFAKLLFADTGKAPPAQYPQAATAQSQSAPQVSTAPAHGRTEYSRGGLLADLPPGVVIESPTQKKRVFDLSAPGDGEDGEQRSGSKTGGASSSAARASSGNRGRPQPAGEIPKDAKGFGSDDVFGKENNQPELVGRVMNMLPDHMKVQLEANTCLKGGATDEDEIVDEGFGHRSVTGISASSSSRGQATGLQQEHVHKAVDRACEGRWVPTYMRHQMAENGHTTVPTGANPNAHEYNASRPVPTVGSTAQDMGQEMGEAAQNMISFMVAVWTSLAFQCQMCTHSTATTTHDRVMAFGEGLCSEVNIDRSEDEIGILPDEATASDGPIRSRVKRSMQGIAFDNLIDICRRRLTTHGAPPEFRRSVKERELLRHRTSTDKNIEEWMVHTEVNPDILPGEAMQHLSSMHGQLLWRERWRIEPGAQKASIEISNEPSAAFVAVILRIDITGSSADGGNCEVDSRLYARPQEGSMLPLGLVEQLFEAHHQYCELLRDLVISIASNPWEELNAMASQSASSSTFLPSSGFGSLPGSVGAGTVSAAASASTSGAPAGGGLNSGVGRVGASTDTAPLPVVGWPVPEKRPPSWAADGPRAGNAPAPDRAGSGLDANLLMKVADGI